MRCIIKRISLIIIIWITLLAAANNAFAAISYDQYLSYYQGSDTPDVQYIIAGGSYSLGEDVVTVNEYGGRRGNFVATGETGFVEWEIEVDKSGLYHIEIEYHPLPGKSTDIERELWINGTRPFAEVEYLTFSRVWEDSGPVITDKNGNEIRPKQIELPMWQRAHCRDYLGYIAVPFQFYFKQGLNTIRLISQAEPLLIGEVKIYQAKRLLSYRQVYQQYQSLGYKDAEDTLVKIQAESAAYKSDPSLFGLFDQGDPTMEPYHPVEIRINAIGGTQWEHANQWITWTFTVPESGLYKIAIKGKQNELRGFYANRRLYIDGEVPFQEADAIAFPHSSSYQMKVVGETETGMPHLFFLEAGEHELKLEVVIGDLVKYIQQAKNDLYDLTSLYRQILMITSRNPDPLRSYQLERQIPNLLDDLYRLIDSFTDIQNHFQAYTGETGGHSSVLTTIIVMLERMADRPDRIPNVISEFRDNIGLLGQWITDTESQPLMIDYIMIASPDYPLPSGQATFWQRFVHEVRAYIGSYTHDYTEIGDIAVDYHNMADQEPLHIWIGLGRDQAQVLKQLIQDTFTPATGISVQLQLINNMSGLLVPAIIAGTAPDVAIGAANMDLAFRGALVDLTDFDDFWEISKRFSQSAFVPYRFRDSIYGLPETQSFPVMFYREDILDELGLEIPQTWDDVLDIIPVLQRHNMEFGITGLSGASMPNLNTFLMFLYQKKIALYKEDSVSTNLDSRAVAFTFKQLTDFFTLYNVPLEYNIHNRFRLGEMPLVVTDYGLYNTLQVFAPELRGKWSFTLVPGTKQLDGVINRAVPVVQSAWSVVPMPVGSSGAVILSDSDKKAQGWEFLKWWTSKDTQIAFGRELESIMGSAARYASANIEAVIELPWRPHEIATLLEQWQWVEGVPPVLGGYYVTRQFDWLFRAIVLDHEPLWESIQDYNEAANREIDRKRIEFGYETDIADIDDRWKELYWDQYTHVDRLELTDEELRAFGLIYD